MPALAGIPAEAWRPLAAAAGEAGFKRVLAGEVERVELELDWDRARMLALAVDRRTAGDAGYIAKIALGLALQVNAPRAFTLLPGNGPGRRRVVGWRLPERLPAPPPPKPLPEHADLARTVVVSILARPVTFAPGPHDVRTLCVPLLRLGRRPGMDGKLDRGPSSRFPGLRRGDIRGTPDTVLRDHEAASWIWHRLTRPGLHPVHIGDEGEPRVRADRFVTYVRKDGNRRRVARTLAARHHVLDATVHVDDPGALALLALSRLGPSGFGGYGMVHIRRLPGSGPTDPDWPSVRALLEGRQLVPHPGADAGAA